MPWSQPACFASADEARSCCDETQLGWGGSAECFNDAYYFWECCGSGAGDPTSPNHSSIKSWPWGTQLGDTANGGQQVEVHGEVHGVFVLPTNDMAKQNILSGLRPTCFHATPTTVRCYDPLELLMHPKDIWSNLPVPLFTRTLNDKTSL